LVISGIARLILDLLKFLAPGTSGFFVVVAGAAVLLSRWSGRPRGYAVALLVGLLGSYGAMSLPWTAARVSKHLLTHGPLPNIQAARGAAVVVVLTGDSERARVIEALRLNVLLRPQWVIVGGTERMREEIADGGVPRDRIIVEGGGLNTREQLINVTRIVRARQIDRIVLVVSAIHMPRTLAAARVLGLDVVPSASPTRQIAGMPPFWPAYNALRLTRESVYEDAAMFYYRLRGWV
jgi:uncharacterized SAM-binding protein YcdF (DUF218 family)